jgi:hypothetical protein
VGLRKKPDSFEIQIKSLRLKKFDVYRELVYRSMPGEDTFDVMSVPEIKKFEKLLVSQGQKAAEDAKDKKQDKSGACSLKQVSGAVLDAFLDILRNKLEKRACGYFVRQLLRWICETEGLLT